MATNALTYIKNVGKSVGYVSFKVIKEMNPVVTEFAETNAEITTTLYRTARDLKKNIKRMPEIIAESEYGKFGKSYLNNLMDDLKTGKFYNKEREDQFLENSANTFAGLDDFDDESGSAFGDLDNLDFGSDEDLSSNDMMDLVGEKASTAVSTAMARSSEYIVESNIQIARANSKQMHAIYGGIHNDMATINHNIAKVIEFSNEQTINHYENSRTFYETTTSLNQERNQLLKSISESLTKLTEPPKEQEIRKGKYGKAVDYDGVLDIENYFKIVKDNIQAKSGGLFDMFKMMTETTGLQNLVASPLEFLVEGMIKSVIPNALKKSMDKFNQSLSGLFGNAMMYLQNKADNDEGGGLWRSIADIFGIESGLNTSIDTRQYEKGKVPFDGITRKAIVEVIPTYLSKILSALTGGKETRYNYEDGRFNTVEELRKKYNEKTESHASTAASELSRVVKEYKNRLDLNEEEQKRIEETWKQISQFMYKNGTNFNTANKKLEASDFGLSGDEADLDVKLLQHLIDTYGRTENMRYAHRMYRERDDQNEEVQRLQHSTTYNSLFNRSEPGTDDNQSMIKTLVDGANNAIVSELVNIKKEVTRIVDMMSQYGPGFRKGKKRNQKTSKTKPQTVVSTSTASEGTTEDSESSEDEGDPEPPSNKSIVDIATEKIVNGAKKFDAAEAARIQKEKEEAEQAKIEYDENGNPIKKKKKRKTIGDRFRSFKKGSKELIGVPLNFVSAVIDKADQRLYDMIFGYKDDAEDEEENSFLGKMLAKLEDIFDNFSDYLHEKILDPLSEKLSKDNLMDGLRKVFKMFDADLDETIESVKNFFFDPKGSIGSFFEEYKQNMKDIFGWGKSAVKDTAEWAGAAINPELTDAGKAVKAEKDKNKKKINRIDEIISGKSDDQELQKMRDEKKHKKEGQKSAFSNSIDDTKQLATGIKRVDRTGLAIISEGEMVIPPDMNPHNIAERVRNEKKVKDRIKKHIDSAYEYAIGKKAGTLKPGTNSFTNQDAVNLALYGATRPEDRAKLDAIDQIDPDNLFGDEKNSSKLSKEAILNKKKEIGERLKKHFRNKNKELDQSLTAEEKYKNGEAPITERVIEEAASAVTAIKNATKDMIGDEKEIQEFKAKSMDFISDVKQYGPTMAAGATVGAGVSILTGLIGGPLVGAAVGAGAGLLAKSETFQEMLFGKLENGERQGGLLSKELSNNIRKYLPDTLKGGTVGGILAALPLVPGSPLMGMMLGSAVGFAKNSETVQEFLFGEDALLGDKKQFQEKVRRILPKMGVGALAGLLAGPFTTPVNLILGSALGFASDSKLFRDIVLGEEGEDGKRSGGFVGQIKDFLNKDIFDPVKRAKDPIMEQFRIIGESVKDSLFNVFRGLGDHVKSMLDDIIAEPLKKFANNAFKVLTAIPKAIISAPFKAIGLMGDALRTRQVKRGQASRYMQSAEDRMLYRQSKGMDSDRYSALDTSLAGITDFETLDKLTDAAAIIKDKDKKIEDIERSSTKNIYSELKKSKTDNVIKSRVMKYIDKGRYEEAIKTIEQTKFGDPTVKKNLIKTISREQAKLKQTQDMRLNAEDTTKSLLDEMEKLGLNISPELREKISVKGSKEAKNFYNILKNQKEYALKYVDQSKFKQPGDNQGTTTGAVNALNETTKSGFEKAVDLLEKSLNVNSDLYKGIIDRQEKIYNAIGGVSDNPEADLAHRNDADIRSEGILNDARNKMKDISDNYTNKGLVGGTVGVASDIIRVALGMLGKTTRAVAGTAADVVGGTIGAAGEIGSDIKDMYETVRNTEYMKKEFGDRNTKWMDKKDKVDNSENVKEYLDEKERKRKEKEQKELEKDISNAPQKAEGQVPGEGDAHSLFGLWKDISKATKRMAATVIATAHLNGLDTSNIKDTGTAESYLTKVSNKFKRNTYVTQFVNGLPIKMIRDKNGELIPDPSSSENDDNFDIINSERETQKGILASLQTMPSALGGFFKDIFADDEEDEKESWFDKIFDFFTGAKDKVNNLKNILLGAFKAAIPLGLTAFATMGGFDNLIHKITGGAYGEKGSNNKNYVTDENGNTVEVKTDENGNPITDENGNYITVDDQAVDAPLEKHGSLANMSFGDRLKYNFGRSLIDGNKSVIGQILKKNRITKNITKMAKNSNLVQGVKKVLDHKVSDDMTDLFEVNSYLDDSITKLGKLLKGCPFIKKYANKIDDFIIALKNMIRKYIPTAGDNLRAVKKSFGKLMLPIAIATGIADFVTGAQDASTTLKIRPEDVEVEHQAICGILRLAKNFIPVIGTLIPDSVVADFIIDYVASWFNRDASELKALRSKAEEDLKKYNDEYGTDLSWTEYNKQINKSYTITEKVGNAVRSGWENAKQFGRKVTGNAEKVSSTVNSVPMTGSGSGLRLFTGRGSDETFVSQVDPRYKDKRFNIPGDTQVQTLGNTGCAPAAAAMAINTTMNSNVETMESAAKNALRYKVNDDGVSADYFGDQFARHGIDAKYINSNGSSTDIMKELMQQNKVVLMGEDKSNTSKKESPFGANPHYVVATGLSQDGKYIYINDPESNKPNIKYKADKILRNTSLGISAKVANGTKKVAKKMRKYVARGSYGSNTNQYKVWHALRNAGYNEIATAAAMGNIEAESGFEPDKVEAGSGAGYGLIQWTGKRRTAFEKYAADKGVYKGDLALQIEYLLKDLNNDFGSWTGASHEYGLGSFSRSDWSKATDIENATKAFMCCFERPSYDPDVNHIVRRLQAAAMYYEEFTGTPIDVNLNLQYSTYGNMNYDPDNTNTGQEKPKGFLGELFGALGGLAKAYGLINDNSTSEYASSGYYNGGISGNPTGTVASIDGNVSSNPEYADLQKKLVKKMYSVYGTLGYSQAHRNPDTDGSADCSSLVRWAYQKVLGIDPGGHTGAQRELNNNQLFTVATDTLDESKLQLGDLLLKNGHVEMYAGNGKMIGHGGPGYGPTEKALTKSREYDMVRRWVGFQDNSSKYGGYETINGSGSGIKPAYSTALKYVDSNKSKSEAPLTLDTNKLGKDKSNVIEYTSNKVAASETKSINRKPVAKGTSDNKPSSIDPALRDILLQMLELFAQVIDNTSVLSKIYTEISDYFKAMTHVAKGSKVNNDTSSDNNKMKSNQADNTAILAKQNLINSMQSANGNSSVNAKLMRLIEATERIARQ